MVVLPQARRSAVSTSGFNEVLGPTPGVTAMFGDGTVTVGGRHAPNAAVGIAGFSSMIYRVSSISTLAFGGFRALTVFPGLSCSVGNEPWPGIPLRKTTRFLLRGHSHIPS